MNTLISNQYGRVQGQLIGKGLALTVDAETPRHASVHVQLCLDAVDQQLKFLAVLRAVEQRIDQLQLKNSSGDNPAEHKAELESVCLDGDPFLVNGGSKNKIYGRFAQFLIYEQGEHELVRLFFAARNESKQVARFDLHAGEVQAFRALVEQAVFRLDEIDVPVRDDISLCVGLGASARGIRFEVQTALWQAEFPIETANQVGTLAVFARRVIDRDRVSPIQFGPEEKRVMLRRRPDGQIVADFKYRNDLERMTVSTLHVYELEALARYALHRAFEPACEPTRRVATGESALTTQ